MAFCRATAMTPEEATPIFEHYIALERKGYNTPLRALVFDEEACIAAAESGADRELDYDYEEFEEKFREGILRELQSS